MFNTRTHRHKPLSIAVCLFSGCHDMPFIFNRCWLVDMERTHHSHIGYLQSRPPKKVHLRRGETTKALIPRLDDVQQGKQKFATFFTAWNKKKKKRVMRK